MRKQSLQKTRVLVGLLAALVLLVILSLGLFSRLPVLQAGLEPASHTHFRFGHITWEQSAPNTAQITFVAAFRRGGYSGTAPDGRPAVGDIINEFIGGTNLCFGDGVCTGTLRFRVFAINEEQDWLMARALEPGSTTKESITHIYTHTGPFTAFSATCCRTSPPRHINNPDGSYKVETLIDFERADSSPKSLLPPIVDCPRNAICSFTVAATLPPGGRELRWRLSTSSEAGPGFTQPGPPHAPDAATIHPTTGVYVWDTRGATLNPAGESLYSTQVMIEAIDADRNVISKSSVDFFIRLAELAPSPHDMIRVPVRWCAVEGSPTANNPDGVQAVLLERIRRANNNVYTPQARIMFHAAIPPELDFDNFPLISDPEPPPTGAGALGDIVVHPLWWEGGVRSPEAAQAMTDCINAWISAFERAGFSASIGISAVNLREILTDFPIVGPRRSLLGVGTLGIGRDGEFEGVPIGVLALNDREFLDDPRELVLSHELGHALTLPHHPDRSNLMYETFLGDQHRTQLTRNPDNLDDPTTQVGQVRAYARRIGGVSVPFGVDPPFLGDVAFALAVNLPESQEFVDLTMTGIVQDQQAGITAFYSIMFGPFPDEASNLRYFILLDADGNPITGASAALTSAELGVSTTFEGVDFILEVEVGVTNGTLESIAVVKQFQAGAFITIDDPSILVRAGEFSLEFIIEEGAPIPEGILHPQAFVALQLDSQLVNLSANPRFQGIAWDPNTQTVDSTTEKTASFVLPTFPQCQVSPGTAILGSTVTVEASELPANEMVEVFLGNQRLATAIVDNVGNVTADLLIPEEAPAGVRPVSVAVTGTAITADCVVNFIATPKFDVPPSPPSGASFTVAAGNTLTFTIQVSDAEPDDVVTLSVIDLPSGANFPIPAPGNPISSTFTWTPTTEQVGSYVVVFTASDDKGLSAPPHSVVIHVREGLSDVGLAKSADQDPVAVGVQLSYILTVTNSGPSDATGVTLTDTLPLEVDFVSTTPSQGDCWEVDGEVVCFLGDLVRDSTATVTIEVVPTLGGTVTNTATVAANERDPDMSNNSAAVSTTVYLPVSIDIRPGSDVNPVNPGSKGVVPVAILSDDTFNAPHEVLRSSLMFGSTGDEESLHLRGRNNVPNCGVKDVNDDGLPDLVCHFETQKTGFQQGDTEGILKGMTVDGVPIVGVDSVRIVSPGVLVEPAQDARVRPPVLLRVDVQDDPNGSGIAKVRFITDASGQWLRIGEVMTPPYELLWDMEGVPVNKTFLIGVEIYDQVGNRTDSVRQITRQGKMAWFPFVANRR